MKLLKEIFDQMGFITAEQMKDISEHFPNMKVIIRWGGMPREVARACSVADRIKWVEDSEQDYVRDVFIEASTMNNLREAFGEARPY